MSNRFLVETQYLPPVEFFCAAFGAEEIILESHEHFTKQTYRNRCIILGPNKVQSLVIPVRHKRVLITEVEIDYSLKWWKEHWRTLETAYNKTPYMEFYRDEIKSIYEREEKYLFDFNRLMLTFCLKSLGWTAEITGTKNYEKNYENSEITDIRGIIVPKRSFEERSFYTPVPYFQQFGKAFVPNMSILDLLMSMGPESNRLLQESRKKG